MEKKFSIEGKEFALDLKKTFDNSYTVNSMPYNYTVVFIDKISDVNSYYKKKFGNSVEKRFVLYDQNVSDLYKNKLPFLNNNGFYIKAVEQKKSINTVLEIIESFQKVNITKKETVVAVGGGITQDLSAFSTAIYKRGIDWSYLPTTLLSMSDSCIGAKTALNYKTAKNQLALFTAPKEVIICAEFLKTLDKRDVFSGYGEILKLVIIGGEKAIENFNFIYETEKNEIKRISNLIKLSLQIKKLVIEADEFEKDIRRSLNYGHTVGHAIEPLVKYKIPHGIAVSIGMILENNIAVKLGFLDKVLAGKYNALILKFVPVENLRFLKTMDIDLLIANILKDKKNLKNVINFAVPRAKNTFDILKIDKAKLTKEFLKGIFSDFFDSFDYAG